MDSKVLVFLTLTALVGADELAFQEFAHGNNLFTAHVYKEVSREIPGNFIVSPFSAETVLALAQSGAREETKYEILSGLSLPNSTLKTEAAFKHLLPTLHGNENYKLHTANKIYVQSGQPIRKEFADTVKTIYQADAQNIDFSKNQESAQEINEWVERQTDNKVKNLVHPDILGEKTRVVLVNALYFKGKWLHPFESYNSVKKNFYSTPERPVQVEFMQRTDSFNYYDSEALDARFLELPFIGGDVSLVFVLPNKKDGLSELEGRFEGVLEGAKFAQEQVAVGLPKFSVSNNVRFKEILENLGIKRVFHAAQSDLSGISGIKGDLFVSNVLQKSFINVTEAGTEAAAASAVFAEAESLPLEAKYTFDVDRPFLFYLKAKGVIIIVGRITELEEADKKK